MTTTARGGPITRFEFALLCLLAFVLPTFESPKTVLVLLLFASFFGRRIVWGGAGWSGVAGFLALWMIAASGISTAVNWPLPTGLKGFKDTLFQVGIFWVAFVACLSDTRRRTFALWLTTGTLVGLGYGVYETLAGKRATLEFHSAGVVTQSSIYLGIVLLAALARAWLDSTDASRARTPSRVFWWASFLIMSVGLVLMASRGAILAVGATLLLFLFAERSRALAMVAIAVVVAAVGMASLLPNRFDQARMADKIERLAQTGSIDSNDNVRMSMWRIAAARFVQGSDKVFGIGPRNFPNIDLQALRFETPVEVSGGKMRHAHNLFLNKLVEEGLFGLAAMLAFMVWTAGRLYRDWREAHVDWPWYAAVAALTVPVIAGSFNTPWHQEHALLAMLLLGIYWSTRKPTTDDGETLGASV